MKTRRRLPRALQSTMAFALGLLLGVLLTAVAVKRFGRLASPGSPRTCKSAPSETAGLPEALWRCEQALAQAHARLAEGRGDGAAWLRVASLEIRRADLLALQAYSDSEGDTGADTDPAGSSDFLWRQRFLRTDPEGALSRAAEAAERALLTDLDRPSRRRALLLLANARSALGDHAHAAEALGDAVRQEPDQAMLWMLLAGAYRRAGRFAQAEAALRHADARSERRATKP